jgi:tetratricopeptide (TPR) repeat protein
MEFSPFNGVVKLCLQGMEMEEKGQTDEAAKLFLHAWKDASNDSEKFLAAHYISRHQKTASDKLNWLMTALDLALKVNNDTVNSALPSLYSKIASCHEELGNSDKAKDYLDLANSYKYNPSDKGPFYQTKALFITAQKRICRQAIC